MTNRFHIVVSNHQRIQSFVDNFPKIMGFNPAEDSILIFDCSPENAWKEQLTITDRLCKSGLKWNKNLFFIRRRNWGMNIGGQMDYVRVIRDKLIEAPKFSAFMQEHYLDIANFVKEDTLPENTDYNLDQIAEKFESDNQLGCIFHARYGVRVAISDPIIESKREFFGDGDTLIKGAVRRGFLVDGGNFIVRPEMYVKWFDTNPKYLTSGDGSYGFTIVWEARLGQILYDQRIKWCDLSRNLEYSSIAELDALENSLSKKISKLWYDNRVWYFYYGRDQWKYPPLPLRSVLRYFPIYTKHYLSYQRNTNMIFFQPKDFHLP